MKRISRKFEQSVFYSHLNDNYSLLPFKFHRLNDNQEIIVNEVGDYKVLPTGTVERIVHRKIEPEAESELYADLVSSFFISETPIPPLIDIYATRYRTKKSFLEQFTSLHIFVMTLRCEHSCQYCQVSRVSQDKNMYDMSTQHIDKSIDMMMRTPNPNITMEFQGGESLIVFDNVKYSVEKTEYLAAKNNKNVTFVLCTNLALVNNEILEFCKQHKILVSTSLDGPEFVHNSNRHRNGNNSYALTIDGINQCKEILGFDKVSALMTTSPLSLQYPIEIVDEYFRQGFRNIFLRPISPYGYAQKNFLTHRFETEKFLDFYKSALNKILEYNYAGEIFIEDYAKIILEKILTPFPISYVDLMSPAGIINNVIVFNYDGKVFASDESRMLAEMNDFTFQLGDLDSNTYEEIFYGKKAYEIAQNWSNESLAGCSECGFQVYCGSDPVRYHATQNDMYGFRPSSGHCVKNMEIIRYLIDLMTNDKDIEKIFRNWISPSSGEI